METLSLVIYLFLAAGISFAGSLQAGLVNTRVLATALAGQARAARAMALGGALPEVVYCLLAAAQLVYFQQLDISPKWLQGIGSGLLIIAGAYNLWWLRSGKVKAQAATPPRNPFWRGVGLASINPQLLLFWSGVLASVNPGLMPVRWSALVAFSLGAGLGAWVLLTLVAAGGKRLAPVFTPNRQHRVNQVVGVLLLALGLAGLYGLS